ncbi:MAG: MFS transporter [Bacillota bacterium]
MEKFRLVTPYLAVQLLCAAGAGIHSVVFPLFLLEAGYDESFLGFLASIGAVVTGGAGLIAPLLLRRLGFKITLAAAVVTHCLVTVVQALLATKLCLVVGNVASSLFGALVAVGHGPYLSSWGNSHVSQKLLSVSAASTTAVSTLGSLIGGRLPQLMGKLVPNLRAESIAAYRACLLGSGALVGAAIYPAILVQEQRSKRVRGHKETRLGTSFQWTLIASVVLGFGAGMVMPFMSAYWKKTYGASAVQVGAVTALTGLAVALGASVAYPLAQLLGERIAIPLLLLASLPPLWAFFSLKRGMGVSVCLFALRTFLANATTPMRVGLHLQMAPPKGREWASSLDWLAWNVGWSLGSACGGYIAVSSGYGMLFRLCLGVYLGAALLYGVALM